ncbi:FtsK/SpoIIIE domain-containing protein [Georgenia alba]|uniref:FtsK/SpoIIIE domain-containing protein n=1 Tax=Georgenia alba TaxID=2233858 RepID=A0ABW2Q9U2_9MICO
MTALLRTPPAVDVARSALRTPWHLAVVAGPDTGWCAGLGPDVTELGRRPLGSDQVLPLTDPLVSRRHVAVRARRGRLEARDLGSANGTRLRRARRRRRRRGPRPGRWARSLRSRWRPLGEGDRLELGRTVLEVRRRPDELRPPSPPEPERRRPARDWLRLALPLVACVTMVPILLVGSANPWRWAVLAVPVALVVAMALGQRRARPPDLPDAATVLLLAASRAVPADPGETLRVRLGTGGRRSPAPIDLADGDRVALVGPDDAVLATGRWLVAQLATCHPASVELPDRPRLGAPRAPWQVVVHREPFAAEPPVHGRTGRTDEPSRVDLVLAGPLEAVPAWCTRVLSVPDDGVAPPWANAVADLLAAPAEQTAATAALPGDVPLRDLVGPAEDVGNQWREPSPGLSAPIGISADGLEEIDLVQHGPHALIAGTTGAGKSELLLAWLVALGVRYSPRDLQLLLVDYKGGATFAPLAGLPHVAGVLTDLDPAATTRALTSLRAEVRRRERLLAAAGAKDLAGYREAGPDREHLARLVVVVDEFRALAESHQDVLDALVRLATQGRSLGIHLVLATQRPGGSVGADVRANLTLRICLRVLEPAESHDVIGSAAAAELPAVPGRAVVRGDGLRTVQAPWCGADGWVDAVVARAAQSWRELAGSAAPPRPWAPPLPERVALSDLATEAGRTACLPLATTDLPQEQRLGTWHWEPDGLLVVGGPGTGRTTTLRTVLAAALAADVPVHLVAAEPARFTDLRGPSRGTVVGADDPRRVARLLERLDGDGLLLVDDADLVTERLDLLAGTGQGAALLARAVRDARRSGVRAVLSGPPSLAGARWLEPLRTRLVLAAKDETEALVAGVPRDLVGGPPLPGRGVLVEPGRATVLQVATAGACDLGPPRPGILRLAPLPEQVPVHTLPRPGRPDWTAVVGRGGDDAGPVRVRCGPGEVVLVVGPPGSGRTTALRTMRDQLAPVPGSAVAPEPGDVLPGGTSVVVLDDADTWPVHHLEELAATTRGVAVLASARPESVAAAYRGPLALWRARASLLLLRPSASGPQLTDVPLRTAVDPTRPHQAGLGVLVTRGRATPVQVASDDGAR